ncbi:MAG: YdcF family protein, partial [Candidatus Omnitrophica bacterium]|nr:YdcF family protein [Candidatus Omnitrophota bacterium]
PVAASAITAAVVYGNSFRKTVIADKASRPSQSRSEVRGILTGLGLMAEAYRYFEKKKSNLQDRVEFFEVGVRVKVPYKDGKSDWEEIQRVNELLKGLQRKIFKKFRDEEEMLAVIPVIAERYDVVSLAYPDATRRMEAQNAVPRIPRNASSFLRSEVRKNEDPAQKAIRKFREDFERQVNQVAFDGESRIKSLKGYDPKEWTVAIQVNSNGNAPQSEPGITLEHINQTGFYALNFIDLLWQGSFAHRIFNFDSIRSSVDERQKQLIIRINLSHPAIDGRRSEARSTSVSRKGVKKMKSATAGKGLSELPADGGGDSQQFADGLYLKSFVKKNPRSEVRGEVFEGSVDVNARGWLAEGLWMFGIRDVNQASGRAFESLLGLSHVEGDVKYILIGRGQGPSLVGRIIDTGESAEPVEGMEQFVKEVGNILNVAIVGKEESSGTLLRFDFVPFAYIDDDFAIEVMNGLSRKFGRDVEVHPARGAKRDLKLNVQPPQREGVLPKVTLAQKTGRSEARIGDDSEMIREAEHAYQERSLRTRPVTGQDAGAVDYWNRHGEREFYAGVDQAIGGLKLFESSTVRGGMARLVKKLEDGVASTKESLREMLATYSGDPLIGKLVLVALVNLDRAEDQASAEGKLRSEVRSLSAGRADVEAQLKVVANFLAERDPLPSRAEVLMVFGSGDMSVPVEAAKLYHAGKVEKILLTGGVGRLTGNFDHDRMKESVAFLVAAGIPETQVRGILSSWAIGTQSPKPEAQVYRAVLEALKVPEDSILVEDKSTDTGKNVQFSEQLLDSRQLKPQSIVLMQFALAQILARATFQKQFKRKVAHVYSYAPSLPDLSGLSDAELIRAADLALGSLQRLNDYGPNGKNYLVQVDIPKSVSESSRKFKKELTLLAKKKEKIFRKAIRDVRPKWWDRVFVQMGAARRAAAAIKLGEFR